MAGKYTFLKGTGPDSRTPTCSGHKYVIKLLRLLRQQKISNVHLKELVSTESAHAWDSIFEVTWD